jgi:hypothetical protein
MHHLVDLLNPAQVRKLRLLVTQDEELSQVAEALSRPGRQDSPEGLLALIGSINGPEDLGEQHDYHVSRRMRERFGDSS